MAKIIKKVFILTMICLVFVSCASMKSKHYAGEKSPVFDGEMQGECIWQFEDRVFHVHPIDSSTAVVSSLEWDKTQKRYNEKKATISLSAFKEDEFYFLNLKLENEGVYTIFRIIGATNEKDFILFTVDAKTIERHMKAGKVKASKKGNDYILDLAKKELDAYVKENLNELFNHDIAGIIRRIHCKE